MATVNNAYSSATAITITLTSLSDNAARQSTEIDNTSNLYLDALVRIKTEGLAGSTDTVNVYAYGQVGNDVRTDSAGATDAAITVRNARLIGVIQMNATTPVVSGPMSVASAFGGALPPKWGIIVENNSGASLSSTAADHDVDFVGITATVA